MKVHELITEVDLWLARSPESQKNSEINTANLKRLFAAGIKLMPFFIHPRTKNPVYIYDYSGRKVIVVDMGGFTVPFYISTGLGGKETVEVDKWYPLFGIHPDWFNKGSSIDINNYYGSEKLKQVAVALNTYLPLWLNFYKDPVNVGGLENYTGIEPKDTLDKFFSVVNRGLNPQPRGNKEFIDNANSILRRVGGKLYSQSKPKTEPEKQPADQSTVEPITGPLNFYHNDTPLYRNGGMTLSSGFGRSIIKQLGDDYRFWDENQFRLQRMEDKKWKLIPNTSAKNKTMINGKEVTTPTILTKGMRIAVGNPEKHIEKLPLIVQQEK